MLFQKNQKKISSILRTIYKPSLNEKDIDNLKRHVEDNVSSKLNKNSSAIKEKINATIRDKIIEEVQFFNPAAFKAEGEARANALKSIFQSKFTLPNHIFANYYDDHIDCERCIETVTPIAKSLGLKVNSSYGYNSKLGGNEGAANAFKDTIIIK